MAMSSKDSVAVGLIYARGTTGLLRELVVEAHTMTLDGELHLDWRPKDFDGNPVDMREFHRDGTLNSTVNIENARFLAPFLGLSLEDLQVMVIVLLFGAKQRGNLPRDTTDRLDAQLHDHVVDSDPTEGKNALRGPSTTEPRNPALGSLRSCLGSRCPEVIRADPGM